jgi:hypothetical protein
VGWWIGCGREGAVVVWCLDGWVMRLRDVDLLGSSMLKKEVWMNALDNPGERWLQTCLLARLCWVFSMNFHSKKGKSMIPSVMLRLNGHAPVS